LPVFRPIFAAIRPIFEIGKFLSFRPIFPSDFASKISNENVDNYTMKIKKNFVVTN
jgi:hypothetical protein